MKNLLLSFVVTTLPLSLINVLYPLLFPAALPSPCISVSRLFSSQHHHHHVLRSSLPFFIRCTITMSHSIFNSFSLQHPPHSMVFRNFSFPSHTHQSPRRPITTATPNFPSSLPIAHLSLPQLPELPTSP
ncbi:hypothetical protein BDV95DRAFT_556462 [Massariosphaeria phaeospora]|uniref:Uncharacterized protein n=1 Tax=Massariosphaeria phaeospora TaxID=100035 RepID=A0A7C8MDR2_9PLEO|nr:hypothetical protein BDV95DRAFT_556462 [Massariosphaeria phaeospora]